MRLTISLLTSLIIFIAIYYVYEKSLNKDSNLEAIENKQAKIELQNKLNDLTSLSSRISKKNIYLDLEQLDISETELSGINSLAFKKVGSPQKLLCYFSGAISLKSKSSKSHNH